MEITIVEPCPECGTVPNKLTITKSLNNKSIVWLSIKCPSCGWTWETNDKELDAYTVLRNWNDSVVNVRIEKLAKPCPYCGNKMLVLEEEHGTYFIVCTHCRCKTGLHNTKENALKTWNRRPDKDA